jgi:two-component system, NtrC family, nitrogen regulation response regulator GlnG
MSTNGTDDGGARGQLATLARVVAGAVPTMVDRLASTHPRRVYREAMAMMERPLLLHALSLTGGNQLRAARLLGVNRNTLRKRCRDLGLEPSRRPGRAAGLTP